MNQYQELTLQHTRSAFLWTRILSIPFWAVLNMLPIILYKDLHISPFQVTMIIALKPISALLAPYWSQSIYQRQDLLKSNLIGSNILRYLPFLFFPWVDSPWLMIAAFSFYMMFTRGAIPAWMEVFKRNMPEISRERVFAYGTALDYFTSAILPIGLGMLMDGFEHSWRWIFPISALLGIISTVFLWRIPSTPIQKQDKSYPQPLLATPPSLKEKFLLPWKRSWELIKSRPDFAQFQIGFMFGAAGLMVMQPALPMYFVDVLSLSYTEMLLAIAVCKAIGYAATSPLWLRYFRKIDIFTFSGTVILFGALFPFLLLGAPYHLIWLYLAYVIYGMMQAGSEFGWHMSGPVFAKEEDSSIYSGTNVITVGIRGCIAPLLGGLLCSWTNSTTVMLLGSMLCLLAARHLIAYGKAHVSTSFSHSREG